MLKRVGMLTAVLMAFIGQAQDYELKSTVAVYHDLQELQRGLRVLYIAAHPDDENTRLIAWLENDQHVETAYLSLTRGQGGQNLIGDEKGDGLGVIRSYELLEARKVDGGEQFFTRAIDFGYSKSADESFEFWNKEEILSDVVHVIRAYRPHVIITRFPPTRNAGHGHHEASAILAEEAFDLAADPAAFPEQLKALAPWKTTAMYHNTSSWWDKSLDDLNAEQLAEKQMHRVDVGVFNDLLGFGTNEIASLARSKHRCQAFGTPRSRGEQLEYLLFVKGTWNEHFISDHLGVWERSPEHAEGFQRMVDAFDFTNREANLLAFRTHVLPLLSQRSMWAEGNDMQDILAKVDALKLSLAGLRLEVYVAKEPVVIGSKYPATLQIYNSSAEEREIMIKHEAIDTTFIVPAEALLQWDEMLLAPSTPSNPFWLQKAHDGWRYNIDKATEVGLPSKPDEQVNYAIKVQGQWIKGASTIHRKWNDRSIGEIIQPMAFVPSLTLTPSAGSVIVRNGANVQFDVVVSAFENIDPLEVVLDLPKGVLLKSAEWPSYMKQGQERTVRVELEISDVRQAGNIVMHAQVNNHRCDQQQLAIDYPHIPYVLMHSSAEVSIIPLDLTADASKRILYVEGSGDEVDESLEAIGYTVVRAPIGSFSAEELQSFDCIITGIRAFNQNEELAVNQDALNAYAKAGGKLIVQYNTTYDLKVENIGPFPLTMGRDRVADENSEVKVLVPKHPVFNSPNTMLSADWNGWVQERGLYFAKEWSKEYQALLSWSDKGEDPVLGGLLVADYGEGKVVYTGISFFRQLPAGVPGAYKLMVNLIEF